MKIELELLSKRISDLINYNIENLDIDVSREVNSLAIEILNEIKSIIQNEEIKEDYDVVEEIVCIFEKYNIDAGFRHDY